MKTRTPNIKDLNKLGEQGWQVVDGIHYSDGVIFLKPKPKKKEPDYCFGR